MPVYTVDVACRSSSHDYAGLFDALRKADALLFMEARWFLDIRNDLAATTRALLSHCAVGDGLFVTELAPETRWTGTELGDEAKAWIAARTMSGKPPAKAAERPTAN